MSQTHFAFIKDIPLEFTQLYPNQTLEYNNNDDTKTLLKDYLQFLDNTSLHLKSESTINLIKFLANDPLLFKKYLYKWITNYNPESQNEIDDNKVILLLKFPITINSIISNTEVILNLLKSNNIDIYSKIFENSNILFQYLDIDFLFETLIKNINRSNEIPYINSAIKLINNRFFNYDRRNYEIKKQIPRDLIKSLLNLTYDINERFKLVELDDLYHTIHYISVYSFSELSSNEIQSLKQQYISILPVVFKYLPTKPTQPTKLSSYLNNYRIHFENELVDFSKKFLITETEDSYFVKGLLLIGFKYKSVQVKFDEIFERLFKIFKNIKQSNFKEEIYLNVSECLSKMIKQDYLISDSIAITIINLLGTFLFNEPFHYSTPHDQLLGNVYMYKKNIVIENFDSFFLQMVGSLYFNVLNKVIMSLGNHFKTIPNFKRYYSKLQEIFLEYNHYKCLLIPILIEFLDKSDEVNFKTQISIICQHLQTDIDRWFGFFPRYIVPLYKVIPKSLPDIENPRGRLIRNLIYGTTLPYIKPNMKFLTHFLKLVIESYEDDIDDLFNVCYFDLIIMKEFFNVILSTNSTYKSKINQYLEHFHQYGYHSDDYQDYFEILKFLSKLHDVESNIKTFILTLAKSKQDSSILVTKCDSFKYLLFSLNDFPSFYKEITKGWKGSSDQLGNIHLNILSGLNGLKLPMNEVESCTSSLFNRLAELGNLNHEILIKLLISFNIPDNKLLESTKKIIHRLFNTFKVLDIKQQILIQVKDNPILDFLNSNSYSLVQRKEYTLGSYLIYKILFYLFCDNKKDFKYINNYKRVSKEFLMVCQNLFSNTNFSKQDHFKSVSQGPYSLAKNGLYHINYLTIANFNFQDLETIVYNVKSLEIHNSISLLVIDRDLNNLQYLKLIQPNPSFNLSPSINLFQHSKNIVKLTLLFESFSENDNVEEFYQSVLNNCKHLKVWKTYHSYRELNTNYLLLVHNKFKAIIDQSNIDYRSYFHIYRLSENENIINQILLDPFLYEIQLSYRDIDDLHSLSSQITVPKLDLDLSEIQFEDSTEADYSLDNMFDEDNTEDNTEEITPNIQDIEENSSTGCFSKFTCKSLCLSLSRFNYSFLLNSLKSNTSIENLSIHVCDDDCDMEKHQIKALLDTITNFTIKTFPNLKEIRIYEFTNYKKLYYKSSINK